MDIKSEIIAKFTQGAREQYKRLAPLTNDLALHDSSSFHCGSPSWLHALKVRSDSPPSAKTKMFAFPSNSASSQNSMKAQPQSNSASIYFPIVATGKLDPCKLLGADAQARIERLVHGSLLGNPGVSGKPVRHNA